MSSPQHPLDPCRCWGITKITLSISHCPSLNGKVRTEIDKVMRFVNEQTFLNSYGKVRFQELEEANRSANDVSSLSPKADA